MRYLWIAFGLALLLIGLVILLIYLTRKHPAYAPKTSDGFSGVPISKLAQPASFYEQSRVATLNYLVAVYPAGKESLSKLSALELASFYNSLWFYYNCSGEYKDFDLEPLWGTRQTVWDPLPCASSLALPYTPQGWLYNFYTYQKFNVPEVYSNSDSNVPWLQVKNAGSTRVGIMGTYQGRNARSSGIMWVPQRTIQRDVWYPNGLRNEKILSDGAADVWTITVGSPVAFQFPNGWYGHLGDNRYVEVTHSPANTGDAINMSPWWWYNVSVGSGVFLNLGKTLAVKNKISGIFIMADMLARTDEGRRVLTRWYNSADPYVITWGVVGLCGFDASTNQLYCDFGLQECGNACWPNPIGYAKAAGHLFTNFYMATLRYQRDVLHDFSPTPTSRAIHEAIDLAVANKDYDLAHVAEQLLPDETNFFLGLHLGLDTLQFYEDPQGNDNYVFELIDLRIPSHARAAALERDYSGFMNIYEPHAKPVDASPWVDPSVASRNSYKVEAIQEYLKTAYEQEWLSIRDPLDVYNSSKVLKCEGIQLALACPDNKYAQFMGCSNLPFIQQWRCLALGNEFNNGTCQQTGSNITC